MTRFHIILSLTFLLFTATSTTLTLRTPPPPVAATRQLFRPSRTVPPMSNELESDKRRVPTGPNPLHNKR
ncbi:hypothetical protein HanXRQr2_Chr16g0734011 [Helianthus annuus]|uniref:Uncharacterized protein n=1 Tax=Helianthus annuus TaxID=4232 RepID=A0A9K3DNW5_HELAN|nr:hypothetical protein HanXRQr2_Chr16g0734011 [Helianthus annuus]KAJ0441490.1 hypothetical protein HanIR_Chr16g0798341 [Helianthus annuus]KAJ0820122.1 hypothetical protein HanPSC8_Chr16g0704111 [Helianthus annuus]